MPDILIAPNSFKECADSSEIAEILAKYLPPAFLGASKTDKSEPNLIIKPLSDGGDGFLNAVRRIYPIMVAEYEISAPVLDNSKFLCPIGYCKNRKEVYIESAEVLGLKRIPYEKRRPLELSSKGLGNLLELLAEDKINGKLDFDKVIIGIGGTGTVDFGMGLCGVFGMKLYDGNYRLLESIPKYFPLTRDIEFVKPRLPFDIEVVIDVDNPLTGENGAARIFAPQKGASGEDVELLENGIENILHLLREKDVSLNRKVLSGAGGGLGGCLHYFFDASYKKSDEFILETLGLRSIPADIIITGEGSFDRQSMMNKASGIIIKEFSLRNIPVYVCCGKAELEGMKDIPGNVVIIELTKYFDSPAESIKKFDEGLKRACSEIAEHYIETKKYWNYR